jgi:hypothetical protein
MIKAIRRKFLRVARAGGADAAVLLDHDEVSHLIRPSVEQASQW